MRRRRSLATCLAAAALTIAVGPVGGGPHIAAAGVAQQPPGPAADPAAPALELVDQTTWLDRGDRFDARVNVARAPAGAGLRVAVHRRLQSRSDFQDTLDGGPGPPRLTGPIQPLPPLLSGPATVTIATDGSDGAQLDQGVYPVSLQLVDAGGEPVASLLTYLVIRPSVTSDFPPLAVGVVVDIAGAPALRPDGSVVPSSDAVARAAEREELLRRAPAVTLTVAPQPETLDGLAGADGGGQLLRDLDQAIGDRPVLARPYTDVDVAALMAGGVVSELNAQAEAGANVVRSRLGTEPVPGVWMPDGVLGEAAAALLVDVGVTRAVLAPEAVEDVGADGAVPEEPVRLGVGGPLAMVSDTLLASRLTAGDRILGAQRFVAELAITWLEQPANRRGMLVHLPAGAPLDSEAAARALNLMSQSRILQPVPVAELFSTVPPLDGDGPPVVSAAPQPPASDLSPLAPRLERAHDQVSGFGQAVGDPEAGLSLEHSLLMATGQDTPEERRLPYIDRVTTELRDLRGIISAPEEFRITLTSRSGTIPLNLNNASTQPIDVRIVLESDQLDFPDGDVIRETLQPGATRIDVRVRTRTSGAFPLNISIQSPDGTIVLETTRFDIRSTTVSGVGLVLSIGAGLFLAVWWARNWRATRRSRRLIPAGSGRPPSAPPAAPPPPPPPAPPVPAGPAPPTASSRPRDNALSAGAPPRPTARSAVPPAPSTAGGGPPDGVGVPAPPPPPEGRPDAPRTDVAPPGAAPDADGLRRRGRYRPAHMASRHRRR